MASYQHYNETTLCEDLLYMWFFPIPYTSENCKLQCLWCCLSSLAVGFQWIANGDLSGLSQYSSTSDTSNSPIVWICKCLSLFYKQQEWIPWREHNNGHREGKVLINSSYWHCSCFGFLCCFNITLEMGCGGGSIVGGSHCSGCYHEFSLTQ